MTGLDHGEKIFELSWRWSERHDKIEIIYRRDINNRLELSQARHDMILVEKENPMSRTFRPWKDGAKISHAGPGTGRFSENRTFLHAPAIFDPAGGQR
jgi:hypothetical protein